MMTIAPGKSMSGSLWTPIIIKETIPATVRPKKSTSGGIGFRIDQAEMFLKFIASPLFAVPRAPMFAQAMLRSR